MEAGDLLSPMVEEEAEAEELPGTSGAKRTDLDGLTACDGGVEDDAEEEVLIGIEKESCRVGEEEEEEERAMAGPMTAGGSCQAYKEAAQLISSTKCCC